MSKMHSMAAKGQMITPTPFYTLGLFPSATAKEVGLAYRTRVKMLKPYLSDKTVNSTQREVVNEMLSELDIAFGQLRRPVPASQCSSEKRQLEVVPSDALRQIPSRRQNAELGVRMFQRLEVKLVGEERKQMFAKLIATRGFREPVDLPEEQSLKTGDPSKVSLDARINPPSAKFQTTGTAFQQKLL